jgi:hypothetical protein
VSRAKRFLKQKMTLRAAQDPISILQALRAAGGPLPFTGKPRKKLDYPLFLQGLPTLF